MILVQSSTGPSSLPLASLEARTQVVSSMRRVIRQSLAAPHDMMTDEISPCAPCTAVAVYSVVLWLWSHVACSVYTSATGSTLKRFGHSAKQAATCQCQLPWPVAVRTAQGRQSGAPALHSSTVCNRTLNSQYSHGARQICRKQWQRNQFSRFTATFPAPKISAP